MIQLADSGRPTQRDRLEVVRPPLPAVLGALLGFATGLAVSYGTVIVPPEHRPQVVIAVWVATPILLVAGCAGFVRGLVRCRSGSSRRVQHPLARTVRLWVLVVLPVAFGLGFGSMTALDWGNDRRAFSERPYGPLVLSIVEGSSPTAFGGWRAVAIVESARGQKSAVRVNHDSGLVLAYGQRVTVAGRTAPLVNPRLSDLARGVVGTVTISGRGATTATTSWEDGPVGWLARARYRLTESIGTLNADYEGKALLAGLLLGERSQVRAAGLEEPFRAAGVSHILSVSGSHLAVVASAVMIITRSGGFSRLASSLAVAVVAVLFTVLTGGEAATERAWCMLVLAFIVHHGRRRTDGLSAVGLTGIGLLATDPHLIFSVGLWLSLVAVAGLVVFTRYLARWAGDLTSLPKVARGISIPIGATLAAQMATLPIAAPVFGAVSLVSSLANLVVVPLTSIAIVAGLVGSVASLLGAPASVVLSVAATVAGWASDSAVFLSSIPGAELSLESAAVRWLVAVSTAVALAVLYVWWPQPRRLWVSSPRASSPTRVYPAISTLVGSLFAVLVLGTVAGLMWFAPSMGYGSRVVFLDVGQGDATLVQSGGEAILIDGGPDIRTLRWELLMAGCAHVDAVITTHDHDDHVAGLSALSNQLGGPPGEVFCASGAESSSVLRDVAQSYGAELAPLGLGGRITVGELTIRAIGPLGPVSDPGANDSCLVVLVGPGSGGGGGEISGGPARRGVLIGGDAESSATLRAVASTSQVEAAVIKVGHHGSADSVSPSLLAAVDPALAVISVGAENRYGHPARETLAVLERRGVRVLRTDHDGRITVRF